MKTRTTTNTDPGHAPERNMSAAHLRPINVSLAVAAHAARTYEPEHRHAVLWLANVAANSQRIQLCWQRRRLPDPLGTIGRISEAQLAAKLGLEPAEIYRALTGHDEADLVKFTSAVQGLRATFEKALPPLVRTADTAIIEEAFEAAGDEHQIAELRGKWRHGKTEMCERQWLLNLHRAVWIDTPSDNTERTFVFAIARALGIGVGSGVKPGQLRDRIKGALGVGLIEVLMLDEAHNLWPGDLRDAKPLRAEYVRELRDSVGLGSMLITTEQFALAMEVAKKNNTRYAPGQLSGRIRVFRTRDKHTDGEIKSIAKLHAGKIEDDAADALVAFAKAEEGYLGTMIQAAARARLKCTKRGGEAVSAADVASATMEQQRDSRIVELAASAKGNRTGRFRVVAKGVAA